MISFTIYGRPEQRGSKTAFVARGKGGKIILKDNGAPVICMSDSNKRSKDWMTQVRQAAGEVMAGRDLLQGPISLSVVFYFARTKSHFGSGKNASIVKAAAPVRHTQTPDLAKLVRCLEDGLSKVVWLDDRQVCCYGDIRKEWTTAQERAEVLIQEIET